MNKKILIHNDEQTFYKGKMLNMPVKDDAIKEKSVELFDDDDPCIIHRSYVMKQFAETLDALFKDTGQTAILVQDHLDTLSFLDVDFEKPITITLKG